MGVTVHHLQASRSDRLFLLLEEMQAPYDVKVHFRNKAGQAEATLAQAVPLGKVGPLCLHCLCGAEATRLELTPGPRCRD